MRMTYSPDGDTLDIVLVPTAASTTTRELAPDVLGDFDASGRLVALELLGASARYSPAALAQLGHAPAEELTLVEAAAEARLSPTTLRVQIRNGRLRARKQGTDWLVARHDLWSYLENRALRGRRADASRADMSQTRPGPCRK